MASYEHLLSPGCIGRLELRNRIFMSPMGSNTADPEGYCGERLRKYYAARAEGGAALLIMGSVAISWPVGSANFRQVAISDDRFIPVLQRSRTRCTFTVPSSRCNCSMPASPR